MRTKLQMTDGRSLEGQLIGEGFDDVQVRTDDKRVHLLRRSGNRFRAVTSETGWPTYNGETGGNRYTTLTQIDKTNVSKLAPRWMFTVPDAGALQVTPVVVDGIMYVTAPNQCFALDAGSGRRIWHYKRPRTKGVVQGNANRGVGVAGDRVFMVTDHAHIIALNRFTGELLWDTELDDWRKNYAASSAPLPAGNLIISGVSGGEHGANGFVAAHDQETGREVWRFWTVPKPGEPGSETWQGKDIEHGGAPTWFTGSYDPALDIVYWPTGNPGKEYNGDDRQGDNLYANSILALERKTGRLQVVLPVHAARPLGLGRHPDLRARRRRLGRAAAPADAARRPQRVLLRLRSRDRQAAAGESVRQEPDLGERHRRRRPADQAAQSGADRQPARRSVRRRTARPTGSPRRSTRRRASTTCRRSRSAASTRRADQGPWESGKSYLGGSQRTAPDPKPQRILRAIDIRTGAIRWELPQPGPAQSWGGTLTTVTGLVIFGEEGGGLMAADAVTGKPLWIFQTNQKWKASPMTYMFDGRQYVAVAAGSNIIALAIPD